MQEKIKFSQKKEALLAKTMPLKDIYVVSLVTVLDFVNPLTILPVVNRR